MAKKKIVKTYGNFIEDRHFKFEEKVINPILECIRDNQEYLTQLENLPQLAKLGYMYNTLWYDGRICWGSDGILRGGAKTTDEDGEETSYWDCEDNPKYKIEMCNPHNGDIENLIYDAWGMHVMDSEGKSHIDSKEFIDLIKNGKPLTELEKKMLKINKTFDEWVEIKTDPSYRYRSLYPNRKSVANHLLCTIGNGYGWNKDGFIIEEASGADQDKALYGDWQNAKFGPQIQSVVDDIISMPQVSRTIDAAKEFIQDLKKREKNKYDIDFDDEEISKILKSFREKGKKILGMDTEDEKEPYHPYYPISSSSDIYAILSDEKRIREGIEKIDQSYIDAAIEICQDIISHQEEENKRPENIEFAKKLLFKYGFKEYMDQIPKEIDKYAILSEIEDLFLYVTDRLTRVSNNQELKKGEYYLHLNDTKNSDYADNNYFFGMSLKGYKIPIGYSNHIEFLKPTNFYQDLKHTFNRLNQIKEIKTISLYCDNGKGDYGGSKLSIKIIVNDRYNYEEDKKLNDKYLESLGFQVGSDVIALETKDYIMTTSKPEPLGRNNSNKTSDKEFYKVVKNLTILNKDWTKVADLRIDERGFNTADVVNGRRELKNKLIEEFNKMKLSNPKYGLYGIKGNDSKYEGKSPLYVHDFMIWLKNNGL